MKYLLLFLLSLACQAQNNDLLAATLILEAGGERDTRAMQAVFEVIDNRARLRGTTHKHEILKPFQFSCWNGLTTKGVQDKINKAKQHKRWMLALEIANNKRNKEITFGATHYHTIYVSPYWAKSLKRTIIIGNHIFYK